MDNNNDFEIPDWEKDDLTGSMEFDEIQNLYLLMITDFGMSDNDDVMNTINPFIEDPGIRKSIKEKYLKDLITEGRKIRNLSDEIVKNMKKLLDSQKEKKNKEGNERKDIERRIDSEIVYFNEMIKRERIDIKIKDDYVRTFIDDIEQGFMRIIEGGDIITLDLIKRKEGGKKGIGEILIEWLAIYAKRNSKTIEFSAVPHTKSNVKISENPKKLYEYYEKLGFKNISTNNNNLKRAFYGEPNQIILAFAEKRSKTENARNAAAAGAGGPSGPAAGGRRASRRKSQRRRNLRHRLTLNRKHK